VFTPDPRGSSGQASFTIDQVLQLSISDVSLAEGDAGSTPFKSSRRARHWRLLAPYTTSDITRRQ
jgi:hypothetical protein